MQLWSLGCLLLLHGKTSRWVQIPSFFLNQHFWQYFSMVTPTSLSICICAEFKAVSIPRVVSYMGLTVMSHFMFRIICAEQEMSVSPKCSVMVVVRYLKTLES
jgi:hypothetical protein